jgi:hypothetical protein
MTFKQTAAKVLILAGATLALGSCAPLDWDQHGDRPGGTAALDVALPADSIYLFENNDFQGSTTRIENVVSRPQATLGDVELRTGNMSSLRWSLPPGVVVTFYDGAAPVGDQMTIWSAGQDNAVIKWDFNDKVTRWAWYHVGGESSPISSYSDTLSLRPLGTQPMAGTLTPGTVEVYEDRDLHGSLLTLSPDRTVQAVRQPLTNFNDKASSLRWNLPPGIMVVFYDNADGSGKEYAIWGSGQTALVPFVFNDKASSWAWYDVGRPGIR